MTKYFKKSKNIILGPFCALYAQISAKMNFPGKNFCQFLNILIIYHCAQNQKKLMTYS